MTKVALVVNFNVKPDCMDDFLAIIRPHAAGTLAEEEGCVRFDVLTAADGAPRGGLPPDAATAGAGATPTAHSATRLDGRTPLPRPPARGRCSAFGRTPDTRRKPAGKRSGRGQLPHRDGQ